MEEWPKLIAEAVRIMPFESRIMMHAAAEWSRTEPSKLSLYEFGGGGV